MLLLIDNYDSFTYNICQAFSQLGQEVKVARNNKITLKEIQTLNPEYIVIGPGPKTPKEAGISLDIILHFQGKIPILGICLGHQAIMESFGMPIVNAKEIIHGKIQPLIHNQKGIFRGIPPLTPITRYHSLVGKKEDLPECLEITATTPDGEIMAIEHKDHILIGLQFHPESIGSQDGQKMLQNFLHYKRHQTPIQTYLKKSLFQQDLSYQEAYDIMDEITAGNLCDAQIASLLTSIEIKGVSTQELLGFSDLLKTKSLIFPKPQENEKRLDIVGTGGSSYKTFNVSTISSIILASLGVNIVKHGNRSATSLCGSADVLEELGININMNLQTCIKCYEKLHITFLFAQTFHNTLKNVASVRKSLKFKTIFNLLGPLINPARNTHQLLGVFDKGYSMRFAEVLQASGIKKALIVSGFDKYDEISLCAPTQIVEVNQATIKSYNFSPLDVGLSYVDKDLLKGGDRIQNAQIALDVLNNKQSYKLDLVCLNAGAALYAYDLVSSIKEGYFVIKNHLSTPKALNTLYDFQKISNSQ